MKKEEELVEQKPDIIKKYESKLKGFKLELLEKATKILAHFNVANKPKEIEKSIKHASKNGEYFADINGERNGSLTRLRLVTKDKTNYNPERKKNYDDWDLTEREEAERQLSREVLVNELLAKKLGVDSNLIDQPLDKNLPVLVNGNADPRRGEVYLLTQSKEDIEQVEEVGQKQGELYADMLLDFHDKVDGTSLVSEIKKRLGIKTELELFQQVFEDYPNHFTGYTENTGKILSTWEGEDESRFDNYITPRDVERIKNGLSIEQKELINDNDEFGELPLWLVLEQRTGLTAMKSRIEGLLQKYQPILEPKPLDEQPEVEHRYYLVHGDHNEEKVKFGTDNQIHLTDWSNAGLTTNKYMAMVYDLGSMMANQWHNPDFIKGVSEKLQEKMPLEGQAVTALAKLRSFGDAFAGLEKDFASGDMDEPEYQEKLERIITEIKSIFE